jgi:concanavalin A-like lectin/glucanase superfamily protein
MAIRFDAAGDRVYLAATLPAPGTTGLTILGWWRIRVDTNTFSAYFRTSGAGGTPTINSAATFSTGQGVNVFTTSGEINSGYTNAVDEWVAIAVTDAGAGVSLYVQPFGGSTTLTSGVVGSGTPGHFCIGGRSQSDATEPLNGNAAHVRVYSAALSQTELEAEWASTTPVRTSGLWADYPFVDSVQDASGNGRHLTAVSGTPAFEAGPDLSVPDTPYRVTVSTTPVLLTPTDTGPTGRRMIVRNTNLNAANTVSLGGSSSVTASNGFLLDGGSQLVLPLSAGEELWAVRGASTDVTVHLLRAGD